MAEPVTERQYQGRVHERSRQLMSAWMSELGRADEKRSLMALYEAGAASIVELDASSAAALPRYQQVQLRGRYDSQHQILLDNMPSQHGQPGYRVVTPLAR